MIADRVNAELLKEKKTMDDLKKQIEDLKLDVKV